MLNDLSICCFKTLRRASGCTLTCSLPNFLKKLSAGIMFVYKVFCYLISISCGF